ncbi:MAG: site-specific integrase [Clostridiales bacterium]|nr:site-specific integrase [Clostridiales bacterium]MCF8023302.1 site-specific integrase [Clostridiales bacterium]
MEFVEPIRDIKKIEAIKKILKGNNLRDYCLFTLGINSGLRVSDLLSLKVSDVVSDKGKVKDRIAIRERKTNKVKNFPVGTKARKALEEYLRKYKLGLDMPLFLSRKGSAPISRQHAHRILNEAAASVGIKDRIGTHTLRKTFGYHAYKKGYDITLLQKLFNHTAPSITLRYIGITQDELDDVYLSLDL